jgi:hypothetical protein
VAAFERVGRRVGVLAGSLALAGAGVVGAIAWMAAPAGAVTVSNEEELRAEFTASSQTQVELANDITLDDCSGTPAGEVRRNSNTALTLDGKGFTVTQICPTAGVFGQSGGAAITFQNITITGGHQDNNDTCYGGGIRTSAPVTVLNSAIRDNFAACSGGGISVGSSLTVRNSTISGNTSGCEGGGIFQSAGPPSTFELTNSTVTGNETTEGCEGGGVRTFGMATIVYSTLVDNTADAGGNLSGYVGAAAILNIFGTVVASPLGGGDNCSGFVMKTSNGFNWDDDGTCGFNSTGDHSNAGDPGLGALGQNGGPTQTREPVSGSPLIDAIPTSSCQNDGASGITDDQRFLPRPALNGCDIGAVEVQPTPPTPPGPEPGPGPGEGGAGAVGAAQPVTAVARFTG